MLKHRRFLLLLALPALQLCSRKPAAPPPAPVTCSALSIGSADRQSICAFYDDYVRVLNDKKTEVLLPYIAETYKGEDGMNAAQIRAAMKQQMSQFPWRDAKFTAFTLTENGGNLTIRHKMNVSIPEGMQITVGETITWTRSAQGNWQIVNWQHKE